MYSTDVTISGHLNSSKSHYVCVQASVGPSTSDACYELSFMSNPESDSTTLAFLQRNVKIQFIQPTLKDRSRILCKTGEKCHILLYTSFASSRRTCTATPGTSGSFKGCDKDDKDNDEDDPDSNAKNTDPCCEDVISSAADVTVFKAHPRGPSCVTEASFTFASAGEKDICFQSAKTDNQQVCYKVGVYDTTSDPCSNSPCLNNGHCFHTNHINFKCICAENYNGDKCEKGPCQPTDNNCQNGAYCQTNNGAATCICKAGYSGQTCNIDPSSLHKSSAEFTDTAKPSVFSCVIRQKCSIALLLTGQSAPIPTVSPGYVDSSLLLDEIETVDRSPVQNSYQTNIKLKPLELGEKDMCIQTKDVNGVNKDELCFKVKVVSDVISIYGFKDRPHFIEPSMPTNTEVECLADQPCHVLYHVTPGTGNENECITFHPHPPTDFVNYHLFSTCENCNPGGPGNGNCTVDVSVVNTNADVSAARHFCLSVGLKGSSVEGENRCFDVTVKDPSTVGKTGCQNLECKNGGFCDGHDPAQPVCFCPKGFSGTTCEKAEVNSTMASAQKQTLIGDFAVPTEIKCVVNQFCSIPFQIISKSGITPTVSLGFNDPRLVAETPKWEALGSSSTEFQGYAVVNPNAVGDFQLCLQASLNSQTDDELCVKVEVFNETVDKTDKTKPYFLQPTIETDSTVVCEVKKSCHFDMHFTKGDMFSFVGKCPTLTETSPSPVEGVHIFDGKIQTKDCTADVSYVPPLADGDHKLCLQVALPGKKGENRCYTIKVVNDVKTEVISPCRAVTCGHDGKCVADFTSTPAKSSCICTSGFVGTDCKTVVDKNKDLPGVVNLNGTSSGNQHFEINYAIPTDVQCEENTECCINTPYHGDTDKPPKIGYKDSNLTTPVQKVLETSSSDPSLHIAQTCVTGPKGSHRICQQTTTNGTEQGVNIDEVCTNITIGPKKHHSGTTGPYLKTNIPDGSKVLCQPNTICHNTVFTATRPDGQCSQARECGNGVLGVHVFQTSFVSGVCTADVAIKTGNSGTLDLCISAGSGGEENHLKIEVESKTGFGPCQKLHCLNGGSCIANLAINPICHCLAEYTGLVCETDIDDCSTNPCKNDATCVDKVNNYTCNCVTGYTGRDCET
ncbi:protein eyes shut homolog, partial [Mercenaria mercenaria]|uniref:protein eyes shut homolog n=1 Tax=Mercenaria mercenaria TaxID=6596 RepID=UPI00234F7F85